MLWDSRPYPCSWRSVRLRASEDLTHMPTFTRDYNPWTHPFVFKLQSTYWVGSHFVSSPIKQGSLGGGSQLQVIFPLLCIAKQQRCMNGIWRRESISFICGAHSAAVGKESCLQNWATEMEGCRGLCAFQIIYFLRSFPVLFALAF